MNACEAGKTLSSFGASRQDYPRMATPPGPRRRTEPRHAVVLPLPPQSKQDRSFTFASRRWRWHAPEYCVPEPSRPSCEILPRTVKDGYGPPTSNTRMNHLGLFAFTVSLHTVGPLTAGKRSYSRLASHRHPSCRIL